MKFAPMIRLDWPRKFVALLCACLIWFSVQRQIQEEEVFRDIPVTLQHSKDIIVLQQELLKVNITLRGSQKRIRNLTTADIKITGQVSDEATRGRYTVLLRDKNVDVPGTIQVVDIQPNELGVYVDKVELLENVPIRCRFTGQLPEGYGRKSFSVTPKAVRATGPSNVVRELTELVTEAIELDQNVVNDFEVDVPLVGIPQVTLSPDRVRVSVELYKMKGSKFFGELDIFVLTSKNSDYYDVRFINPPAPHIEVVLSGPKSIIDILTSSSLRPFIDISNIPGPGTYRLPVHVWTNANDCVPLEIKPMILEVAVERASWATTNGESQ